MLLFKGSCFLIRYDTIPPSVRLFAIIERATAVNPDAHWPLADGQFPGHKKSPGREAPGALREKQ